MKRLFTVAGVAALGPITGPLALGLVTALRDGRHAMAGVYAVAIVETWILLPLVTVALLQALHRGVA